MTAISFSLMSSQHVLGALKSTGSTDPDVLAAAKEELLKPMRVLKFMGIWAYVTGGLCILLVLTAFLGVPLVIFGWWVRRRAGRNIETIEATFGQYLASVRNAAAVAV